MTDEKMVSKFHREIRSLLKKIYICIINFIIIIVVIIIIIYFSLVFIQRLQHSETFLGNVEYTER